MRRPLPAMFVFAGVLIAGCISYPGLTDDAADNAGGTSNTSPGGSASTGGSPSGGAGGGNTGPTQPDETTDPNQPPAPGGSVAERICSRIIVIEWTAPAEEMVFYYGTGSNFNAWEAGDAVEFDDESGDLINQSNGLHVRSERLGEIVAETFLRTATQVTLLVVLGDGSAWLFSSTDYGREVTQWLTNGDPITVVREPGGSAQLINTRRCTATAATEQ